MDAIPHDDEAVERLVDRLFAAFRRQVDGFERKVEEADGGNAEDTKQLTGLAKTLAELISLDRRAHENDDAGELSAEAARAELAVQLKKLATRARADDGEGH